MGLSRLASLGGSLLFGLHPAQTEVISYVSARSESLAALFYLSSMALYLRSRSSSLSPSPLSGLSSGLSSGYSSGLTRHGWIIFAGSLLTFTAALLSKAVSLTLPAMLLLHDFYRCDRNDDRNPVLSRMFWHLPFWLAAAAYILLYRTILSQAGQGLFSLRDPISQLATQAKAVAHYLKLATLPVSMSVHPQFAESPELAAGPPLAALLMAGSLIALAIGLRRRQPLVFFGTTWFFVALIPILSIPLNILVNDHRIYLELFGPVLAVASLTDQLPRRWLLLVMVMAGLFAAIAIQRDAVWRNERSLWEDAAARGPQMPEAHYNLAYAQHREGDLAGAEMSYERAIDPTYARAHINLGAIYREKGEWHQALGAFRRALAVTPRSVEALNNVGLLYADHNDFDRAVEVYEQALTIDAEVAELWLNLGLAYRGKGLLEKAFQCLSKAVRLDPEIGARYPPGGNM